MIDEWDIGAASYWVITALHLGLVLLAFARARRALAEPVRALRERVWQGPGTVEALDALGLHPYELAYLHGGASRVAEAVLAALIRNESLRVSREGRLTRVVGGPGPSHPLEEDALSKVGDRPHGTDAPYVRWSVHDGPPMAELREGLVRRGLLVPLAALADVRRATAGLPAVALLPLLVPCALLVLAGWPPPGERLLATAALAVAVLVAVAGAVAGAREATRAVRGIVDTRRWSRVYLAGHLLAAPLDAALREQRRRASASASAGSPLESGTPLGLDLALVGLLVLDPETQQALADPPPSSQSHGGGGGDGGSGGGDGGASCGGGCGGCGG